MAALVPEFGWLTTTYPHPYPSPPVFVVPLVQEQESAGDSRTAESASQQRGAVAAAADCAQQLSSPPETQNTAALRPSDQEPSHGSPRDAKAAALDPGAPAHRIEDRIAAMSYVVHADCWVGERRGAGDRTTTRPSWTPNTHVAHASTEESGQASHVCEGQVSVTAGKRVVVAVAVVVVAAAVGQHILHYVSAAARDPTHACDRQVAGVVPNSHRARWGESIQARTREGIFVTAQGSTDQVPVDLTQNTRRTEVEASGHDPVVMVE